MKISIASDHGGFNLKEAIKDHFGRFVDFIDCGCFSLDSCDYPDFGYKAALMVSKREAQLGIVICTTGIGMSIVANKVKRIRCALVTDVETAQLAKEHNNANVLALGSKNVSEELAFEIVDAFIKTEFSGASRHLKRINKISEIEENK